MAKGKAGIMKSIVRAVIAVLVVTAFVGVTAPVSAKEQPPAPMKMKELKFPDFKEFNTKNGIDVLVVEHKEQPVISIYLAFKTGDSADPQGKESLAGMTVDQLNKGTKDKDALQLATWIESVGGNVSASSQTDVSVVSVTLLSDYVDTAWDYLAEVILNPTFPEEELEIIRKRIKTSLELELSDPDAMADRHFSELVYGDHPYGKDPTVESVESITRDDLVSFYGKNYVPNNVLIGVVGDVKWKDVRKAIEKRFSHWAPGTPDRPEYVGAPEAGPTKIYLYNKPGAVQTEIRVGHVAPKADSPDWPAFTVANRILGGGADARLFMILREEKGWTYGAYSHLDIRRDLGSFTAGTQVRTEVTDSALVEVMHQLNRMRDEPVSDEDLKNAKDYLIGNFPIQIETPNQIAGRITRNKLLGRDPEYLETWRDRLAAVTVDDVKRVMDEYVHPDRSYIVLVGDASEISDKVATVAAVSTYDIAGEPLDMAALAVEPVDYAYDTSKLKDGTATYEMKYQSMNLGDLAVTLKSDKDVFLVTTTMNGMIKLDESMQVKRADLAPVSYRREMQTPGGAMGAEFDFTENAGSGVVRMPTQPGKPAEPKEVTFEMVNGTLIDSAVDLAVSCLPMQLNAKYRFPVIDSDSGSLMNIDVEILELVTIETAAGTYETFKVRLARPQGEQLFYIAKTAPHVLVKMEVPAQGLVSTLKALN